MWVRTTTAQVEPGHLDEFVRQWREYVAPHAPEIPGLRTVFLCGNRDTDTVLAIHLWDTLPGEPAHDTHDRHQFRDHVRDILVSGEPLVAEYEVLAQGEGR